MKKRVEFPAYYRVKQHKNFITPQIDSLSEVMGVSFTLVASVHIHFKRLITLLGIALQPGSCTMVAKECLDGSGRHAIHNQLGNVEIHNMRIWMWVPLSQGECNEVWVEGAPCSPDAARPIMITMGKENSELLAKIVPPVDVEIGDVQQNGVTVEDNGKKYTLKIEFHRSMSEAVIRKRYGILRSVSFLS